MKLPLIGQSYEHPSVDVNKQRCVNMFPMTSGPQGRGDDLIKNEDNFILMPTAGLLQLIDLGVGESRCLESIGSYVYTVVGATVYRLTVNHLSLTATSKSLGTLGTTTGTVHVASNPTQVIFVDGSSNGYIYEPVNSGTATVGIFGGTASDTYSLTINGTAIYTNEDVSTALNLTDVVTQINTLKGTTGITASGTTAGGVITLTATDDTTITVTESGTGFVAGTDGITVTGGEFAAALPAFRTINDYDSDFPGATHVVFVDGYFVVNEPATGQFYFSALNDGMNWDPLDVATAESSTDDVNGLGVSKGELWVFGDSSTEIWYNAANASGAPFSVRTGLEIGIGCGAPNSIVRLDDLLIWLDNRGFIVQSNISPLVRDNNSGYQLVSIATDAISAEILSYETREDAIAMGYTYRGHLMYQISFPTAEKTWVFDYTSKQWHERAYYNASEDELEHHLGQYYAQYETVHLMSGVRNGEVFLVSPDYYDDDGVGIRRIRTTAPQYDASEHELIEVSSIDLRMQSGDANQSGLGSDPQITLRYSINGGHTWSHELSRSAGKVGEYAKSIRWNRLGSGREWVFEFTMVEPIDFSIIEAAATAHLEIEGA